MSTGIIAGNVASINLIQATVDLGSVAANTSETETVTITGLKTTDFVIPRKPTLEAGLLIGTCWVSAADTLSIQVINTTAGAIDETSETWGFIVVRPEGSASTLPTGLQK